LYEVNDVDCGKIFTVPKAPLTDTPAVLVFPVISAVVPTKSFLAIPTPPAVVTVPPLVADVASVVFDIPRPPLRRMEPVVLELDAVESLDIIFGRVRVLEAYVIVDGDWIPLVELPSNTALDVSVVCPVPPFATSNAVPDNPIVRVPFVVRGEPEILRKGGTAKAILVIVPLLGVVQVMAVEPPPCDVNT
jgi:hypothetical protein